MRIVSVSVVLLLGLGIGLVGGCNDGGGGGSDPASIYLSRLQACGLLSDGELPMATGEINPVLVCYVECAARTTCAELTELTCNQDYMDHSPALVECFETCVDGLEEEPDQFTCTDGTMIPSAWLCDGDDDCDDASDEQDCVEFMCVDGTASIPEGQRCDGQLDCADGSDELDCPGLFACADGEGSVPSEYLCDGDLDCGDGSDELGCPTYACANGEQVQPDARCNFTAECEDGSDEQGCAQLVCPP